ncbi:MAG: hypothetical protein DRQ78_00735 [Epsilonproteobacteria bacterium]|nr:MAG: hypothetical protein DRQ78_00735 [Campylobacterota bacterium]
MESLKALTLGNYIRAMVRPSDQMFTPLTTTFQDSKNIWNYLKAYEGMLNKTPVLNNVTPNDGLDGRSLLVDMKASTGFLFNVNEDRPKTISESIAELYKTVDISILESTVQTELASIKDVVGLSRFYDSIPSSDQSIDHDLEIMNTKLTQLAADVFNRGTTIGDEQDELLYSYNNNGLQTQARTIKDLIDDLMNIHGGIDQINHDDLKSHHVWATSVDDTQFVPGGTELYTTVFASGNIYNDYATSQRFYNPFNKDVKMTLSSVVITENSLINTASAVVLVSGAPSSFDIKILPGEIGQFKNDLVEQILKPNDYIQFKIATGSSPTGQIKISNLSMIIEETN